MVCCTRIFLSLSLFSKTWLLKRETKKKKLISFLYSIHKFIAKFPKGHAMQPQQLGARWNFNQKAWIQETVRNSAASVLLCNIIYPACTINQITVKKATSNLFQTDLLPINRSEFGKLTLIFARQIQVCPPMRPWDFHSIDLCRRRVWGVTGTGLYPIVWLQMGKHMPRKIPSHLRNKPACSCLVIDNGAWRSLWSLCALALKMGFACNWSCVSQCCLIRFFSTETMLVEKALPGTGTVVWSSFRAEYRFPLCVYAVCFSYCRCARPFLPEVQTEQRSLLPTQGFQTPARLQCRTASDSEGI